MENKTIKIKNLKQTIIISTDKKRQLVNKCGLPLRFKVPKGYTINKQAKRDSKASYGHSVCDSLPTYTDGTVIRQQDLADMNMNGLQRIAELIGIELGE